MILLKLLREGSGRIIIFFDWVFSPRRMKRSKQAQAEVNAQTQLLTLYQFYACPFCIKTRRQIKRLNLNIKTCDAQIEPFRAELLTGGGVVQVPCLKIKDGDTVKWLYESSAINAYLAKLFIL